MKSCKNCIWCSGSKRGIGDYCREQEKWVRRVDNNEREKCFRRKEVIWQKQDCRKMKSKEK